MNAKKQIVTVCMSLLMINCIAQVPALWNNVQTNQSINGLVLDESGTRVLVWGNTYDSCVTTTPSLLVMDTSGVLLLDTSYELVYCSGENAIRFQSNRNGGGYYLVTINEAVTPQDCCFVYFVDANFAIQWQQYVGKNVRSEIFNYGRRNYLAVDDAAQDQNVIRFYQPGDVDTLNQVTHPYFNVAPQRVLCANGLVMEFGNQLNNDSAFVCMVYDTLGNVSTSFAFDADILENEVPLYIAVHDNQIFHVNGGLVSKTYPACSGFGGATNWIDTLNYRMHSNSGACLDSVNNVGYVMCDTPSDRRLFSYDLFTGTLIDSMIIDSVFVQFTGIKSGPAGGVFLFYTKLYTDTLLLDQYDAQFNLLWRGYTVNPSCATLCHPTDFVLDELGYAYTVSSCSSCAGATILTTKFAPSLVGVSELTTKSGLKVFPNPASGPVTIDASLLNDANTISLFDVSGQCIYSDSFSGEKYLLNTETFSSGLYFIEVTNESGLRSTQKLIIHHP